MSRSNCSGRGVSRLTGKVARENPDINALRPVLVELCQAWSRLRPRGKRRGYKRGRS